MMSITSNPDTRTPLKDRLSLRVASLFFATLILVFLSLLLYDIFVWNFENQTLATNIPTQPAVVDIDPKIESELSKAMTLDALPENLIINDPTMDRSGISITGTATKAGLVRRSNPRSATAASSPEPTRNANRQQTSSTRSVPTDNRSAAVPELDTKDRYLKWRENRGVSFFGEPDAALFAIDDLIPVGVVAGGNGEEEVMFYSEAADQVFSFSVGTIFYDFRLLEIRTEGVVFESYGENKITRLKSWGRSIRSRGSQSIFVKTSVNRQTFDATNVESQVSTGGSN